MLSSPYRIRTARRPRHSCAPTCGRKFKTLSTQFDEMAVGWALFRTIFVCGKISRLTFGDPFLGVNSRATPHPQASCSDKPRLHDRHALDHTSVRCVDRHGHRLLPNSASSRRVSEDVRRASSLPIMQGGPRRQEGGAEASSAKTHHEGRFLLQLRSAGSRTSATACHAASAASLFFDPLRFSSRPTTAFELGFSHDGPTRER